VFGANLALALVQEAIWRIHLMNILMMALLLQLGGGGVINRL